MINRPKKVSTYPSKVSENHDDQKSMMAQSMTSSLQITEYVRLKTGDRSGFGDHIDRPMTRSPDLGDSQRDNRSSIQDNITPRTSFNKTAHVNFTFSKADNVLPRDSMTRSSIETSLANAAVPANISHKRTTRNSQPRAMNQKNASVPRRKSTNKNEQRRSIRTKVDSHQYDMRRVPEIVPPIRKEIQNAQLPSSIH